MDFNACLEFNYLGGGDERIQSSWLALGGYIAI